MNLLISLANKQTLASEYSFICIYPQLSDITRVIRLLHIAVKTARNVPIDEGINTKSGVLV